MHAGKGVERERVRFIGLLQVAVRLTGAPCRNVTVTLVGSMSALNHTRMSAETLTFASLSAGSVARISGLLEHTVVNEKGFGTGPGASDAPVQSYPLTWIVYCTHAAKGNAKWLTSSRVLFANQENVSGKGGTRLSVVRFV